MQIHENVKFIGKKIGWVWSKNASGHCGRGTLKLVASQEQIDKIFWHFQGV